MVLILLAACSPADDAAVPSEASSVTSSNGAGGQSPQEPQGTAPAGETTQPRVSTTPPTQAPSPVPIPDRCPLATAIDPVAPCLDGDGDIIEWLEAENRWVVVAEGAGEACDVATTTIADVEVTGHTRADMSSWYRTVIERLEEAGWPGSVGLYSEKRVLGITLCDFDAIDLSDLPTDAYFFESWPDTVDAP